ncbi:hypothetical protein ACFXHA_15880 [Nocardia sp. NPDC059240]|uniref:hypothetical protein n=1 Tax=Nocardia sp. NPDC059240 TaxID=3346786 RepID=UPI0036C3F08B
MTSRSSARGGPAVAALLAVFLFLAAVFEAGTAQAAGAVSAKATIDGRAIAGANADNPVRLDPKKVVLVVVEVTNPTANSVSIRRVDLAGHVLGLNFYSYSTTVELTVAAGKTEKLTYRLDPAGLDGQATGLIGSDLTLIGGDGKPLTSEHTVIDVRGSLVSVYGLFGIILAVLTGLAIADAALTVARHRLSANRWQRGLRLFAPGLGIGLMIGFTASVARWWVPGTALWLSLAGAIAAVFFLVGYLSPTPRQSDDLGLDPEDLAAAKELDALGFPAGSGAAAIPAQALFPAGARPNPPYGGTYTDLPPQGQPGGTFRDLEPVAPDQAYSQPIPGADDRTQKINTGGLYPGHGPLASAMDPNSGGLPTVMGPRTPRGFGDTTFGRGVELGKAGPPVPPPGDDEPTIRSLPGDPTQISPAETVLNTPAETARNSPEGPGFRSGGTGR